MSNKQKPARNFILLVDSHKAPGLWHNTRGRYRVGAKNAEEAVKLLREKIGFGSIQVYYEITEDKQYDLTLPLLARGEVKQELSSIINGKLTRRHVDPHHANAPRKSYIEDYL